MSQREIQSASLNFSGHLELKFNHKAKPLSEPLEILYTHFKNGKTLAEINTYLTSISQTFNTDKRNIIKQYLYYIIRNHTHILSSPFLDLVENILHASPTGNLCIINYSIIKLSKFT